MEQTSLWTNIWAEPGSQTGGSWPSPLMTSARFRVSPSILMALESCPQQKGGTKQMVYDMHVQKDMLVCQYVC